MRSDTTQRVKINIDAGHGKASKVVIVDNDTIADINITKSDSSLPGLVINGPKFDGDFFHKSHLDVISIIVPVAFFIAVSVIVWLALRFAQRRNEMRHRERMAAIEHGITLPSEIDSNVIKILENEGKYVKPYNPYRWPLILGLCGLAFIITHIIEGERIGGFGLVLLAIGAALFLAHWLRRENGRSRGDTLPPPPPTPPAV